MRSFLLGAGLVCLLLAPAASGSPPSSRLDSVDPCPANDCPYSAAEGRSAVIDDWNGGAYDSVNDRLIVWGAAILLKSEHGSAYAAKPGGR